MGLPKEPAGPGSFLHQQKGASIVSLQWGQALQGCYFISNSNKHSADSLLYFKLAEEEIKAKTD